MSMKSGRETLTLVEAQGGKGLFVRADMGNTADVVDGGVLVRSNVIDL